MKRIVYNFSHSMLRSFMYIEKVRREERKSLNDVYKGEILHVIINDEEVCHVYFNGRAEKEEVDLGR